MNPGREGGFPLDFLTPVRHVATQLDRVAPATLSVGDLASGYTHHNLGDLSRLCEHYGLSSDADATNFLINRAVQALNGQTIEEDGLYGLAVPFGKLRFEGKRLHRIAEDVRTWPGGSQPFNRLHGRYSDDIRSSGDLSELRESMSTLGWLPQFPAIHDEHGVIIVGHRRLEVAAELGIEPVMQRVDFGDGDEADAKRFAYAIASNMGAKGFSLDDRKNLAEYLYGEKEWSMERVADALAVTKRRISTALTAGRRVALDRSTKVKPERRSWMMGGKKSPFTPEQRDFILANCELMSNIEISKAIGEEQTPALVKRGGSWPLQQLLIAERYRLEFNRESQQ